MKAQPTLESQSSPWLDAKGSIGLFGSKGLFAKGKSLPKYLRFAFACLFVLPTIYIAIRLAIFQGHVSWLLFLGLICALALVEELVFRWMVFGLLHRARISPAIIIYFSALLFAAAHVSTKSVVELWTVFISGIVLGIIYHETRKLYLVWVLHILINLSAKLPSHDTAQFFDLNLILFTMERATLQRIFISAFLSINLFFIFSWLRNNRGNYVARGSLPLK
jgi:membrane protease YdiL (CAAX protease family)